MIFSRERQLQALDALQHIYNALCAEDMDGTFRSSYILHEVDDLYFILDPKGKGKKRYERYKTKLQNPDRHQHVWHIRINGR